MDPRVKPADDAVNVAALCPQFCMRRTQRSARRIALRCHPAKAGIQYSRALEIHHWRSGILRRPVEPGDDGK
jgi:hypothetical protein